MTAKTGICLKGWLNWYKGFQKVAIEGLFFSHYYRHATSPPKTSTEAAAAKTAEKFNRLKRTPMASIGPKAAPDDNHAICQEPW